MSLPRSTGSAQGGGSGWAAVQAEVRRLRLGLTAEIEARAAAEESLAGATAEFAAAHQ